MKKRVPDAAKRQFLKMGLAMSSVWLFDMTGATEAEASPAPFNGDYTAETVKFSSAGVEVVGLLFVPKGNKFKRPAIVLLGPFGFVKEQAPAQYATHLAEAGFVTLIFDPRFSGESAGMPRRHESPSAKIADVHAAIDSLALRPEVDANRIGALGICQGSSEMLAVATQALRIKALSLVSGQYIYPKNIDGFSAVAA